MSLKTLINSIFDPILKVLIKRPLISLFMDSRFQFHFQILNKSISDSADFAIKNFSDAMYFHKDEDLWSYVANKFSEYPKTQSDKIIIAEFGVWKGRSINFFARRLPNSPVFGFDSFVGFAQDWSGTGIRKGDFSLFEKLPKVESNVSLIKGWFEETLTNFVDQLNGSQILILHMDADIYEPTHFVLNSLSKNIRRGTIVVFDQFFGYFNFQSHEFRAWHEFSSSKSLEYSYIAFTGKQVAIEIL
jgi:hypothetical protein